MDGIDFPYALDLLKRINRICVRGEPLSSRTGLGGHNLWQWCQQSLFGDIKEFSKTRGRPSAGGSPVGGPSWAVLGYGLLMAIWSLLSLCVLMLSRRRILVYAIDRSATKYVSDMRMEDIYDALADAATPFMEIFHSRSGKPFLLHALRRRRWALYLESIDFAYRLWRRLRGAPHIRPEELDASSLREFSEEEKPFVCSAVARYLQVVDVSRVRVACLTWALRHTNLRALLTIDDTRHTNELLLACRQAGIETYAFQHGHFTKYHVGWLRDSSFSGLFVAPDRLFVWSSYWKRELLRLGTYFPEDSVEIGGLKNSRGSAAAGLPPRRSETVMVLVPFETDAPKSEVAGYLRAMLQCPGVSVVLKLRADMQGDLQVRQYGLESEPRVRAVTDLSQVLEETSLVAGTYSTFLYDMVLQEKPVCLLKTSLDYGEGMIANGLADRLDRNAGDLCDQIRKSVRTSGEVLADRRKRLSGWPVVSLPETLRGLIRELTAQGARRESSVRGSAVITLSSHNQK